MLDGRTLPRDRAEDAELLPLGAGAGLAGVRHDDSGSAGDGAAGPVRGHEGEGGCGLSVLVPVRTINPLNQREHWRARARRVRNERAVTWACLTGKQRPALPCVVTMTRLAPSNGLDCDSLPASCKGIRDEIAKWLKVDDRDPRVTWRYEQRRGVWGVEVSIHE